MANFFTRTIQIHIDDLVGLRPAGRYLYQSLIYAKDNTNATSPSTGTNISIIYETKNQPVHGELIKISAIPEQYNIRILKWQKVQDSEAHAHRLEITRDKNRSRSEIMGSFEGDILTFASEFEISFFFIQVT